MTASSALSSVPVSAVPRGYRGAWSLFTDWCAAADERVLPADPVTVAVFLDENPAAESTQRARVTAINAVHKRCGYPAPGTARALRDRLTRRTRPRPDLRDAARRVVGSLPTSGWPGGLFGRRDALLLVLSCYLDLSPTEIGRLKRTDVVFDGESVRVGGGHHLTVPADIDDPRGGTVPVYLRWARLQAYMDRYPSNRMLAEALTAAAPVTDDTITGLQLLPPVRYDGPLVPAFDRWGHTPLERSGMSRHAITRIVGAHLSGHSRVRPDRKVTHFDDHWAEAVTEVTDEVYEQTDDTPEGNSDGDPATETVYTPERIAATYEAGIAAKHAAAEEMADLEDSFDEIDTRMADLLARTEALLAAAYPDTD